MKWCTYIGAIAENGLSNLLCQFQPPKFPCLSGCIRPFIILEITMKSCMYIDAVTEKRLFKPAMLISSPKDSIFEWLDPLFLHCSDYHEVVYVYRYNCGEWALQPLQNNIAWLSSIFKRSNPPLLRPSDHYEVVHIYWCY